MAFATARAEEPDVELAVSGHWEAPTTSLALAHWPRFTIVTIFSAPCRHVYHQA